MHEYQKKTGFIVIVGRPSSGKSTLINAVCGYKISIISKHPQTTQSIIRGIYNDEESQIIFLDTPGYHHFNADLNRGLSNLAMNTLDEGDLILYLVDLSREYGDEENDILDNIKRSDKPVIIAFNKIDLKPEKMNERKTEILSKLTPAFSIEISALKETHITDLVQQVKKLLPFGPLYYPEENVTDQSIPFRIQEIVREKVFNNTDEEVPHASYIEVESLEVTDQKIIAYAIIYVERESQKGIIIGKKGEMIKRIGEQARADLKEIFEREVNLFLMVKVHLKWRKKQKFLKDRFKII